MDGSAEQVPAPCGNCQRLEQEVAELKQAVAKLQDALAESRRAGKRQAAPFRKPPKGGVPKKPGRKAGPAHGRHAHRARPVQIDEILEAPLPASCRHCGGYDLTEEAVWPQYQTDIPRQPIHRQFNIHVGHCNTCGKRLQGRHALQTSDALGAAASQLGPDLQAALVFANKALGLSHGKGQQFFGRLFGIEVSRSLSSRVQQRLAAHLRPAYEQIGQQVGDAPWVVCDETGWRVGGENAWLHDFVTDELTYYIIDPTRSGEPARRLLGEEYSGILIHDGWRVYDGFRQAGHQQCLAHVMRRCHELLETAVGGAVRFPRAVLDIFRRALSVRDRFQATELTARGCALLGGRLQAELRRLVAPPKSHVGNERLAKHLARHLDALFTFLRVPGLDATNWRAEQAIRPAVVNRKVWGGNRTWEGAEVQAILMTILVSCRQQALNALDFLKQQLTTPQPLLLPLASR